MEHSVIKEIRTSRLFDNLDISLFWEEKALIIIRFAQLYGFLLLIMFETFPSAVR